ncbi:uncharacterized protein LOC111263999 [Varroa jacobsoni]|uniref:Uncharacterized protein n=1 Tax=Varroa destructor TaxID=109461 RepID=A0A7M7KBZ7_VARDE|nr:uncharacterized protein LOC111251821 [Varroa destructor]XP_022695289.1 uncharacterized protein LOC111263999 [Varroa jacobsoni]
MNLKTSGCASVWACLVVATAVFSALACAAGAQPSPGRQQQLQLQDELRYRTDKLRELLGRPIVELGVSGGPVGLQKRPFCNAFTGCAGKRAPFALPSSDKQRLRFFRKFNTIDNLDSDEYVVDNTNYDREIIQE